MRGWNSVIYLIDIFYKDIYMERITLICNSMQSFMDLCENNLVTSCFVHCTFIVELSDFRWMEKRLKDKSGNGLSVTKLVKDGYF